MILFFYYGIHQFLVCIPLDGNFCFKNSTTISATFCDRYVVNNLLMQWKITNEQREDIKMIVVIENFQCKI